MTVANGALLKLVQVIMAELKDKPVRINEVGSNEPHYLALCLLSLTVVPQQVVIGCYVTPWDNLTPPPGINFPYTNNEEMGKALLGVMIHPNSKGASMSVSTEHVSKLAAEGTV